MIAARLWCLEEQILGQLGVDCLPRVLRQAVVVDWLTRWLLRWRSGSRKLVLVVRFLCNLSIYKFANMITDDEADDDEW